jgi:hypothetical protein
MSDNGIGIDPHVPSARARIRALPPGIQGGGNGLQHMPSSSSMGKLATHSSSSASVSSRPSLLVPSTTFSHSAVRPEHPTAHGAFQSRLAVHSDQHDAEVGPRLPVGRRKLILKPAQAPGYGFHGSLESVAGPGLNSAPVFPQVLLQFPRISGPPGLREAGT